MRHGEYGVKVGLDSAQWNMIRCALKSDTCPACLFLGIRLFHTPHFLRYLASLPTALTNFQPKQQFHVAPSSVPLPPPPLPPCHVLLVMSPSEHNRMPVLSHLSKPAYVLSGIGRDAAAKRPENAWDATECALCLAVSAGRM